MPHLCKNQTGQPQSDSRSSSYIKKKKGGCPRLLAANRVTERGGGKGLATAMENPKDLG